ncbi:MAG: hypothetical protein GY778_07230, partial [bacterium]|nr:hypothetical protein [bacterium]
VEDAARLVKRFNSLPGVCGRVCPQEQQCEGRCHLGDRFGPVAIGYLERFLADWEHVNGPFLQPRAPPTGQKVALVGSGPACLTAAGDLVHLVHLRHYLIVNPGYAGEIWRIRKNLPRKINRLISRRPQSLQCSAILFP